MSQYGLLIGSMGCLLMATGILAQKRSVAVQPFEYSTVMTDAQAIFGTQVDIGRGIGALLTKKIAEKGCFSVVERERLSVITQEQNLGASGRVKKGTQARVGEIRGADFTILGDIVTFGRDDTRKAAGGLIVGPGGGGVGAAYKSTGKAVVTLSFRIADNESSEIVSAGEARGESSRVSKGGLGGFFAGGFGLGGFADFSSRNFGETIIGEAVIDSVNKLVEKIPCDVGRSERQIEIEGRVVSVSGSSVYINVGSSAGVKIGDRFEVSEIIGALTDPVTKEVLDMETRAIGSLSITVVREKVASGTYTGTKPAKVSDKVEKR